ATARLADWNAQVDVNLRAPFLCIQAAAPHMSHGGHIVNVADAWSRGAPSGWSAYAASKAGLEALTRVLAVELRPRRIAVNGIAPGPVLKPTHLPPARWRAITRGRTARVADVVAAVVRFAKGSPTVTGQVREIRSRRRRAGR
ncbi:MAG TPA: SDR family oxidoreductase, partial [Caldimonas sp.]|nr:SDR family oxidoreductase [Caldimonas sp.]